MKDNGKISPLSHIAQNHTKAMYTSADASTMRGGSIENAHATKTIGAKRAQSHIVTKERLIPFTGFLSFVTFFLLYENALVINNVAIFNYALFCGIGEICGLAFIGILALTRKWQTKNLVFLAVTFLAELSLVAQLFFPWHSANLIGAIVCGCAMAYFSLAWGVRIAQFDVRSIFIFVLGAMLGASIVCFCCFSVNDTLPIACTLALPFVSCLFYLFDAKRRGVNASTDTASNETQIDSQILLEKPVSKCRALCALPWSFLVILTACSLLSSFFVGVTLNPYIFQSTLVSRYAHLFTLLAFSGMLMCALILKRPRAQLFFIVSLGMLLIGLFLLSTGVLGSIIMPLGLVLAAKNCCLALCWIFFVTLTKESKLAASVIISFGLLICNGTLGQGLGLLTNNGTQPSFSDIAFAASLCITALTLLYVLMLAMQSRTSQATSPLDTASAGNTLAGSAPISTTPADNTTAGSTNTGSEPTSSANTQAQDLRQKSPLQENINTVSSETDTAKPQQKGLLESYGMTAQELRIADLVLQGKTYPEIAKMLGISERTVKFHAKNAYRKTGSESKLEFMSNLLSKK